MLWSVHKIMLGGHRYESSTFSWFSIVGITMRDQVGGVRQSSIIGELM